MCFRNHDKAAKEKSRGNSLQTGLIKSITLTYYHEMTSCTFPPAPPYLSLYILDKPSGTPTMVETLMDGSNK